jgi:5'(3')-deoxyribonucleotidase
LLRTFGQKFEVTQWDVFAMFPPEIRQTAYATLRQPQWWADMPVMPGAFRGVDKLREGHDVIAVVSAPWTSCDGWEHARRDWLKRYFPFAEFISCPSPLKAFVHGDVFVDDKPETLEHWKVFHPHSRAILYGQPYNRNASPKLERLTWETLCATDPRK